MDYVNFCSAYDAVASNTAYAEIDLDFHSTSAGQYSVAAEVNLVEDVITTNNKIFFVIVGKLTGESRDPGYWNNRVIAASESQDFSLLTSGETASFSADFALDLSDYADHGAYEEEYLHAVAIIQSYDNLMILQSEIVQFGLSDSPESDIVPANVSLKQNWPNPFNPAQTGRGPATTIEFTTRKAASTELSIYNLKGQKVITLVNQNLEAGDYSYSWSGSDDNGHEVSSGVYYYILKSAESVETRKMLLMK